MGGRGANSGKDTKMGGGFTSANDGRGGKRDKIKPLYPASFNSQGRFTSVDKAVSLFSSKYKNSDTEYGISVDEQGFTHKHVMGNKNSVAISAAGKNHTIIHNHPSGSNFSKADLESVSINKNEKAIYAVGNKYTYRFEKKKNFKAYEFNKAMKKAKWPTKYDYNKGADWWLKKNADKYGYKYERFKTNN